VYHPSGLLAGTVSSKYSLVEQVLNDNSSVCQGKCVTGEKEYMTLVIFSALMETAAEGLIFKGGREPLKMLYCKSQTQFENRERNTLNAVALLNYVKRFY
jgi:hypothetical protein